MSTPRKRRKGESVRADDDHEYRRQTCVCLRDGIQLRIRELPSHNFEVLLVGEDGQMFRKAGVDLLRMIADAVAYAEGGD